MELHSSMQSDYISNLLSTIRPGMDGGRVPGLAGVSSSKGKIRVPAERKLVGKM